ncbi:hypothetical protein C5167_032920 [Papaver somniferum]|uniref:Uncharacterized protein n=1 Tax=Papaver somniferum TaxID=3469 RepID=A0A4Y7KCU3_PAPSO|nr:hypothetical protein C5167_032920 [Papaver somniferum]
MKVQLQDAAMGCNEILMQQRGASTTARQNGWFDLACAVTGAGGLHLKLKGAGLEVVIRAVMQRKAAGV